MRLLEVKTRETESIVSLKDYAALRRCDITIGNGSLSKKEKAGYMYKVT